MMSRKRAAAWSALGGIAIVGLITGCADLPGGRSDEVACSIPDAAKVVKIGHAAPLSGPIAHLGKDNELGARLAVDEINSRCPKLSGQPVRFELIHADDAADPLQAAAAARRLVEAGVVGVVGHLNSGTSIPASAIYHQAGIPQISPSATHPRLTRQGFATTFRLVKDDLMLGEALGRHAATALGKKRAAVLDDRTVYGQTVADGFVSGFKAAGGQVAVRQIVHDKATVFSSFIQGVRTSQADVVVYGGMDVAAARLMRDMHGAGVQLPVFGGDGVCTRELAQLAGSTTVEKNVFCAEAMSDAALAPELRAFKQRFAQRHGQDVQVYAPYTYDAVNVLVQAMVEAGSSTPAVYLPALAKVRYRGVTGPIAFDAKSDLKEGAITLYTYRDGVRTPIGLLR